MGLDSIVVGTFFISYLYCNCRVLVLPGCMFFCRLLCSRRGALVLLFISRLSSRV